MLVHSNAFFHICEGILNDMEAFKMRANYLTEIERGNILKGLSSEQQTFLKESLKRGKKNAFAVVLAQQKGGYSEEDAVHIAEKWSFVDYIDAGPEYRDKGCKCDCGYPIRYQYIVRNEVTGDVMKLSKDHFKLHTGIPAKIVAEVLKGLHNIDYELDELLYKVKMGWSLEDEGITLPVPIDVPEDIKGNLDLKLPLLDRQVKRLFDLLADARRKERVYREKEIQEDLFSGSHIEKGLGDFLTDEEKLYIRNFINENKFISVRRLCEKLICDVNSHSDRYSTGKPRIYPCVADYLKCLQESNVVKLLDTHNRIDIVYASGINASSQYSSSFF